VKLFVIAILLLVLLPANALARPATVDEARYVGRIEGLVRIMTPSLEAGSELLASPDLSNAEWQMDIIAEARLWSAVYEGHLNIPVPADFSEFDAMISDSFEAANSAAQDVEDAISLQSAESIQSAIDHLFIASGSLKFSLGKLPDVEFPEAGSEASAETPTPEFKTPLNLDAECSSSTITPTVLVERRGTMTVVSGDGAGFVCFDLAQGTWRLELSCVGDTTGMAMFGTSQLDMSPLSPGEFKTARFFDPIEAKLLVTCFREWTVEIVRD